VPVALRAAERATDEDVEATRAALADLEAAAASAPDSHEFFDRHRAFHSALLAPGWSAWIQRVLDQLWQAAERYVRLTMSQFGTKDDAMREHREMVELLAAREALELADLVARHLNRTEETLREGYLAMRAERQAATELDGQGDGRSTSLVLDRT
jgi:DNA-binding GntR family transcriptional regulator